MSRQSPATKAALRAIETLEKIGKRLQETYDLPLGTEEVSEREVGSLMRQAFEGDMVAGARLMKLARESGHTMDGDNCPLCRRAAKFLDENAT